MAQDFFYPTIDNIVDTTGVCGVEIENGLVSSGDFTVPGVLGAAPGVGIGQAIPFLLETSFTDFMQEITSEYVNNPLTLNSGVTVFPINKYVTPVSLQGVNFGIVQIQDGKTFVRFKSACKLFIQTDNIATINVKISYKDYYGNLATMNLTDIFPDGTNDLIYITPRCVYDLYDITFDNVDTIRTSNINIGIFPAFELPYYNLGTLANIMTINFAAKIPNSLVSNFVSLTANYPNFTGYTVTEPGDGVKWGVDITNPSNVLTTPLTASTGTVRPILDFSNYIQSIFNGYLSLVNFSEDMAFTCVQNVYGYGATPPKYWLDLNAATGSNLNQTETSALSNYLPTVIGGAQYSDGWTYWRP